MNGLVSLIPSITGFAFCQKGLGLKTSKYRLASMSRLFTNVPESSKKPQTRIKWHLSLVVP
jgi:hypothetical protein